jgi:coenzyme F420 hydrogenase subunit beta
VLAKHVQWRCKLCADHTGEFADIAVGDPWHKPPRGNEPGRSLIVARTPKGLNILHAAIAAGALEAEQVAPTALPAAQPNLLRVRGAVWGRIWTCRLMRVAVPKYHRLPQFRFWCSVLTLREKAQSIVGTARRIMRRGVCQRRDPEKAA